MAVDHKELVKHQLRDRHGRWIKMGFHVSWNDLSGEHTGIVVGAKDGVDHNPVGVVKEYDKHGHPTGHSFDITGTKLTVIPAKAELHFDAHGNLVPGDPNAHLGMPETLHKASYDKVLGAHHVKLDGVHPAHESALVHGLSTHLKDTKVGDQLYPLHSTHGNGKSPYNMVHPTKDAMVSTKHGDSLGTVVKNDPAKGYVVVKDGEGKQYYLAKHHSALVRNASTDEALMKSDNATGSHTPWISGLSKDHEHPAPEVSAEHAPAEKPAEQAKVTFKEDGPTVKVSSSDYSNVLTKVSDLKVGDELYPRTPGDTHGAQQYSSKNTQGEDTAILDTSAHALMGKVVSVNHADGTVKVQNGSGTTYTLKPGDNVFKRTPESDKQIASAFTGTSGWASELSKTEHAPAAEQPKGEDLHSLTSDQISKLPVGTKLLNADGSHYVKTAETGSVKPGKTTPSAGKWDYYTADGKLHDPAGHWNSTGHEEINNAQILQQANTKGKWTVQLPEGHDQTAPSAHEPAQAPAAPHAPSEVKASYDSATKKVKVSGASSTPITGLKVGDKLYPVGDSPMTPYSTAGHNVHDGSMYVDPHSAHGIGTVVNKGYNGVTIKGEDGKNTFVSDHSGHQALKQSAEVDKAVHDATPQEQKAPEGIAAIANIPNTPEAKQAMTDYYNEGPQINAHLRGTSENAHAGAEGKIYNLDHTIANTALTNDLTVYRGFKLPKAAHGNNTNAVLDSLKAGGNFFDKGFTSTSMDKGVADEALTHAEGFHSIEVQYDLPKGFHALPIDYAAIGGEKHASEKEVVLPRNLNFIVTHAEVAHNSDGSVSAKVRLQGVLMDGTEALSSKDVHEVAAKENVPTHPFVMLEDPGKSGDGFHPSGPWGHYGAAGLLVGSKNDKGEPVFLIVENGEMHEKKNQGLWQLPGGAIDQHEDPYSGSAREMHEELGVSPELMKTIEHVGDVQYSNGKGWAYTNIAAMSEKPFDVKIDVIETSDYKWATKADLEQMMADGKILPALAQNMHNILGLYDKHEGFQNLQHHEPNVPAEHAPAEHTPIAGEYPDKGKTVVNADGETLQVNQHVQSAKFGHGVIAIVKPQTNGGSVAVKFDGEEKMKVVLAKTLKVDHSKHGDVPAPAEHAPADLGNVAPGEHGLHPETGKMYIGDKTGKPLMAGDKISYTKQGQTKTGTVKSIYKGDSAVAVKWDDGSTVGTKKKASALNKVEDTKSETGNEHTPSEPVHTEPAPEHNAPVASEPSANAPEPAAPSEPAQHAPEKPLNISDFQKDPGHTQGGSNSGAMYTEKSTGDKYYVKWGMSEDHANNEVLASKVYQAMGVNSGQQQLIDMGHGKMGIASKIIENKGGSSQAIKNPEFKHKAQEDFAVDALLANWDVAGMGLDNLMVDKNGNPLRIDPGASLRYRAQGAKKSDFGKSVGEWNYLRDGSNHESSGLSWNKKVFGDMTDQQLKDSAAKLHSLTDAKIDSIVDTVPFDKKDNEYFKEVLKARRDDIFKRAGIAGINEEAPHDAGTTGDHVPAGHVPSADQGGEVHAGPVADHPAAGPAAGEHAGDSAGVETKSLQTVKDASQLDQMPVGTKMIHTSGDYFQKQEDGTWKAYTSEGNAYSDHGWGSDSFSGMSHAEKGSYTLEIPKESAPQAPADSGLSAHDGKKLADLPHGVLEEAPVGSQLVPSTGTYTLTKKEDGKWWNPQGASFTTDSLETSKQYSSGDKYVLNLPKGEEKVAEAPTPKTLAEVGGEGTSGLDTLPVGTKIIGASFHGHYFQKNDSGKWEYRSADGTLQDVYNSSQLNGLKIGSQAAQYKIETPTASESSPSSYEGKLFSDVPDHIVKDAPAGSYIQTHDNNGLAHPITFTKGADGQWHLGGETGAALNEEGMLNAKNGGAGKMYTFHVGDGTAESPATALKDLNVEGTPAGTKIYHTDGTYLQKAPNGNWYGYNAHGEDTGSHYTSAEVNDIKSTHGDSSVSVPSTASDAASTKELQAGEKMPQSLIESAPEGTLMSYDTPGGGKKVFYKDAENGWVDNEETKFAPSDFAGKEMHFEGSNDHKPSYQPGSVFGHMQSDSAPVGTTAHYIDPISGGDHVVTKTPMHTWKDESGKEMTDGGLSGEANFFHVVQPQDNSMKPSDPITSAQQIHDLPLKSQIATSDGKVWTKTDHNNWKANTGQNMDNFDMVNKAMSEGDSTFHGTEADNPTVKGKYGQSIATGDNVVWENKGVAGKVMGLDTVNDKVQIVTDDGKVKWLSASKMASLPKEQPKKSIPTPTAEADPSSPWYEKPKPELDTSSITKPEVPSHVPAGFLDEIKQRYADHVNPKWSTTKELTQSNYWSKIDSYMNTDSPTKAELEFLHEKMYISDQMLQKGLDLLKQRDDVLAGYKKQIADAESKYQQDVKDWKAANGIVSKGLVDLPARDFGQSWTPENGYVTNADGTKSVNWKMAPNGSYSVNKIIDAMNGDEHVAIHGMSAMVDSTDIVDNNVRFTKVSDEHGNVRLQARFEVSEASRQKIINAMSADGGAKSNGVQNGFLGYVTKGFSKFISGVKSLTGHGEDDYGKTYDKKLNGGVDLKFQAADHIEEYGNYKGNTGAMRAMAYITLPQNATEADFERGLKGMGVVDAHPSTEASVDFSRRKKLISTFKGFIAEADTTYENNPTKLMTDSNAVLSELGKKAEDFELVHTGLGFYAFKTPEDLVQKLTQESGLKYLIHGNYDWIPIDKNRSNYSSLNGWTPAEGADRILNRFSNGAKGFMATARRMLEGDDAKGMSPSADIHSGGSRYLFNSAVRSSNGLKQLEGMGGSNGYKTAVVSHPSIAFKYLGNTGNVHDNGSGKRKPGKSLMSIIKSAGANSDLYEIMLHNGLATEDAWFYYINEKQKPYVIEKLHERGIDEINGIPIEEFFVVPGKDAIPAYNGSDPATFGLPTKKA